MNTHSRIYVAGHNGLVGSALVRRLIAENYHHLILRSHAELDLICQSKVDEFFKSENPEVVFLAAAKVGGILANNTYPAEFIYDNLAIQTNVIHAAWKSGVRRLIFLGSSCIYPRDCPQPMKEDYLLSGPLENTNEPYAMAKIAGIKMCQSYNRQYGTQFFSIMPTNLYGPHDNFHLEDSHVLPALIRKFHLAKLAASGNWKSIRNDEKTYGSIPDDFRASLAAISISNGHSAKAPVGRSLPKPAVPVWGTGNPRREFLHVDDLADACVFIATRKMNTFLSLIEDTPSSLINIGCSEDHTIKALCTMVKNIVGFKGEIVFDQTKPDGTPQKLLDTSRLTTLGWKPKIPLNTGIQDTYRWYQSTNNKSYCQA